MRVLAFNCGSSSIKCAVVDVNSGTRSFELRLENIGGASPKLIIGASQNELTAPLNEADAIGKLMAELKARWADLGKLDAVVHRVVHGGQKFLAPTRRRTAFAELAELEDLAPLHNPPAIRAMRGARALFTHLPHVAVFDTAFHSTLPPRAREYALPAEVRTRFGIRRYGFHGISYGDVARGSRSTFASRPRICA